MLCVGMQAVVRKVYAEENKEAFEGMPDHHAAMQLFELVVSEQQQHKKKKNA
jgi:hypothetical protein